MMKRKTSPTRRRRAVKWLIVLVLLVAVSNGLGLYGLTPESPLRKQERFFFTGKTEMTHTLRDTYMDTFGIGMVTASQNEDVLLLGISRWTPWRGWQPGFAWPVERSGRPVDIVYGYYSWDYENGVYPCVAYGCVNVERPQAVELTLWETKERGLRQTVELIPGDDGRYYFWTTFSAEAVYKLTYSCAYTGKDGARSIAEGGAAPGSVISLSYDAGDMMS